MKFWLSPSIGLVVGIGSGNKDKDKDSASGGLIVGNVQLQFGASLGAVIGVGDKFGVYTGLSTITGIVPFLNFNFLAIPIGIHFGRRLGLGIIIPIISVSWIISLAIGVLLFLLAMIKNK